MELDVRGVAVGDERGDLREAVEEHAGAHELADEGDDALDGVGRHDVPVPAANVPPSHRYIIIIIIIHSVIREGKVPR